MLEFFHDFQQHTFLQIALLTGLLASVASGVIGSYIVVRRITYIAAGIAHCVLGGIGAACYYQEVNGWAWLHPLYGAVAAGLAAAVIIGLVSLKGRQREDTVIGALWAIGMAIGIIYIFRTPGYAIDPMTYLFGDILMVSRDDVWLLIGLDAIIAGVGLLLYHPLQAVCFDEEFARLRGVSVERIYILLLCLTALTVVLLVSVVGIVMVIALLTLPVAIASHFCRTLWQLMVASIILSMIFTSSGLALCYVPELPPGATTILLAGGTYLLVVIGTSLARALPRRAA